jgi:hypothetical protein
MIWTLVITILATGQHIELKTYDSRQECNIAKAIGTASAMGQNYKGQYTAQCVKSNG